MLYMALRRLLKTCMEASNISVVGDTGRWPVHIMLSTKVNKYWIRITKLPHNRYVKLCYNMLIYYDNIGYTNWVTFVRLNLYSNGLGHIWKAQCVENENPFIHNYTHRL